MAFSIFFLAIQVIRLQNDPPAGISAASTEDDILVWKAVIFGPDDTPFEDGVFELSILFTEEYPSRPPTLRFLTKIFHPNVYLDGRICIDILDNRWSPTYDVYSLLSLLSDPNPSSPANSTAAQLYTVDRREYEKRVKACVQESLVD